MSLRMTDAERTRIHARSGTSSMRSDEMVPEVEGLVRVDSGPSPTRAPMARLPRYLPFHHAIDPVDGGFQCGADVDGDEQQRASGEDERQQHHAIEHSGLAAPFRRRVSVGNVYGTRYSGT